MAGLIATTLANVVFTVVFVVVWRALDSRALPSDPGARHEIIFFDE